MVATQDSGADCAYAIGKACWERVATAGLVLGDGSRTLGAVAVLRPHARVLLPTADESDLVELLTALRVGEARPGAAPRAGRHAARRRRQGDMTRRSACGPSSR